MTLVVIMAFIIFFEDVFVTCPVCGGSRYSSEALKIAYRGKNISDVLNMTIDESADFFPDVPKLSESLSLLKDIGMGYLRLGHASTILDLLFTRREHGLATPKQLNWLRKFGYPQPELATFEEAQVFPDQQFNREAS